MITILIDLSAMIAWTGVYILFLAVTIGFPILTIAVSTKFTYQAFKGFIK